MEELSAGLSSDEGLGKTEGSEPEEGPVGVEGEAKGGTAGLTPDGLGETGAGLGEGAATDGVTGSALEGTGGWEVEIEVMVPV